MNAPRRTPCFEQVRSIWLPRSPVTTILNGGAAAVAAPLWCVASAEHPAVLCSCHPQGRYLRTSAWAALSAWAASFSALHSLRLVEDLLLALPDDVFADRAVLPAGVLSLPAGALSAALVLCAAVVTGVAGVGCEVA